MPADIESFKDYPLGAAIRMEANRTIDFLIWSELPIEQVRDDIDRRPMEIQTALLLGSLAEQMSPITGLKMYFLRPKGDALAPEIADAMNRAGMTEGSVIMQEAMKAVAEVYPAGVPPLFSASAPASEAARAILDERLGVLAKRFGTLENFERRLEGFVRSKPNAMSYFEDVRKSTGAADRLQWLDTKFLLQADEFVPNETFLGNLNALPIPYRHLYVTGVFAAEAANGGMDQFLTNPSGALAPMVVEAFRDMGMLEYADALQEMVDLLGTPYPYDSDTRFERIESMPGYQELEARLHSTIDPWSATFVEGRLRYAEAENVLPR